MGEREREGEETRETKSKLMIKNFDFLVFYFILLYIKKSNFIIGTIFCKQQKQQQQQHQQQKVCVHFLLRFFSSLSFKSFLF